MIVLKPLVIVMIMMIMIVAVMVLPILVVVLLNDIEHGDDVHRLQQPVPSALLQVTDIGQTLVVGKAPDPIVRPVGPVHEMHDSDEHP